jgi:hypothetical protein
MPRKPQKARFNRLGSGALALYASLVVLAALAVYGICASSIISEQARSDRARAQMQIGRMLVSSVDQTECLFFRFDNETAQVSRAMVVDCNAKPGTESSSSLSIIRDSFVNRR